MSQEFRLKNIDEVRNYLFEDIKQNELMSKKHKKVCTTLNYVNHLLILVFTITGCNSVSTFFFFFAWYSYSYYEYCIRTKNLCNSCSN